MLTPAYAPTATERVLPRLALDFTTGALDPRVTVTRALNTATRINSSGLVEIVNADLPRFDYDPATLSPKGLLIEESRANLALHSGNLSQSPTWSGAKGGAATLPTVTGGYATAPDGTQTATRIQLSLGGGTTTSDFTWRVQTLTGTSCFGSFWIKTVDGSTKTIHLRGPSSANITVTGVWTRYSWNAGTLSGAIFGVGLRGGQTPTNSDTADILVWGAQLESGAFATSYIPTTTTSLTRNADVVTMTGANFSDWYNIGAGSWYVQTNARNAGTVLTAGAFTLTANATALKKYANSYATDQSATSLVLGQGTAAKVSYYKQALLAAELAALVN